MAKQNDGHSDGSAQPGVSKGTFEGVGTFSPKPGQDFKSDTPISNHGRAQGGFDRETLDWPGDKEFERGK